MATMACMGRGGIFAPQRSFLTKVKERGNFFWNDQSHRMVFLYLILALTSLSNAATIRDLCAKAKVQSMKRQQSACISKILDNLMSQDNQNPSEVCKIINEATFECIQVFAQCQMHDEVK